MALDFPNSPTIGDEFTGGGFTWVWDGTSWSKLAAAAAASVTKIDLRVGTSGNTTFPIDPAGPAGDYLITSSASDTTYEIYFLASDNTLVGYTTSSVVAVSAEFTKVVLYGAATNDVFTLEQRQYELPTANGDIDANVPPFVTSATPTTLESIDDTTTVTGGNFATDVSVKFVGQDAVDRSAKTLVRSSSTELIVTRPDDFPVGQEPYSLVVTNPGVTPSSYVSDTLTDYFDAGGGLTWVTGATLTPAIEDEPYSTTLQATDADGLSVSYAVTSGSLPSPFTLNGSTGEISGTPLTGDIGSYSFTVTATDSGGNTAVRAFSLEVRASYAGRAIIGGFQDSGGFSTTIYDLNFNTDTFSTLGSTKPVSSTGGMQFTSDAAGYEAGGTLAGNRWNGAWKIVFDTETTSTLGSTMVNATRSGGGGFRSATAGYTLGDGSYNNYLAYVNKLTFSGETWSAVSAVISPARGAAAAYNTEDGARGYYTGGFENPTYYTKIERYQTSTDAKTTLGATLVGGPRGDHPGGFSGDTAGYTVGGNDYVFGSPKANTTKLTFATETTAASTNLSQARWNIGGANSYVAGYAIGGNTSSNYQSTVDKLDFATETVSTVSGLPVAMRYYSESMSYKPVV